MLKAITRKVSPSMANCELTHLERQPIDNLTASAQHSHYEQVLKGLGVEVISLPPEPDLPDSVFVEDTALVLDEIAILTRPGADSRLPEVESIARALQPFRRLETILAPGRLDGGDILLVGKKIFVGLSSRSNLTAIQQLQAILLPHEYQVQGIAVTGCLHLKSAASQVNDETLLINPAWVDRNDFRDQRLIEIDPLEPYAANVLRVGDTLIAQPSFPRTVRILESAGMHVELVDASELGKAEGALTCCSLLFKG